MDKHDDMEECVLAGNGISDENKKRLINRLRRVEGQCRGVQRMIEEDRSGQEIFTQLIAAKAALYRVGVVMIALTVQARLENELGEVGTSPEAIVRVIEELGEQTFLRLM